MDALHRFARRMNLTTAHRTTGIPGTPVSDVPSYPPTHDRKVPLMRAPRDPGRHTLRTGAAIAALEITAVRAGGRGATAGLPLRQRGHTAALALATATTMAFTPIIASSALPLHLPTLHAPSIHLAANTDQIQNLIDTVNAQLNSLDANVARIVGVPGQTLAGALTGAASLNSSFWNTLITASGGDKLIVEALRSLEQLTSGGLTELASSVTSANRDLTLTTGELSTLLTSSLTGSASTALAAFSGLVANPLSVAAWIGLINAPFTIGGGVLRNVIEAAEDLGANGIALGGTIVTGVTAQISNIITAVNDLVSGIQGEIHNNVVNGLITAVQGVVSAPLNAVLALVNGGTNTITSATTDVVAVLATGASYVSELWLGDGTSDGAIQAAIKDIGSAPLSVGSYARAVNTLAQAAVTSVTGTASTIAAGLAPIPLTAAASLVTTVAGAITSFTNGVAQVGAGLLQAAGVPALVYKTMYGLAGAFNTGVQLVAGAVSASLNAAAAVLKAETSLTGLYHPAAAAKAVSLAAVKTATGTPGTTNSADTKGADTQADDHLGPATHSASSTKGTTTTGNASSGAEASPRHASTGKRARGATTHRDDSQTGTDISKPEAVSTRHDTGRHARGDEDRGSGENQSEADGSGATGSRTHTRTGKHARDRGASSGKHGESTSGSMSSTTSGNRGRGSDSPRGGH
jgi:hypothetical protein